MLFKLLRYAVLARKCRSFTNHFIALLPGQASQRKSINVRRPRPATHRMHPHKPLIRKRVSLKIESSLHLRPKTRKSSKPLRVPSILLRSVHSIPQPLFTPPMPFNAAPPVLNLTPTGVKASQLCNTRQGSTSTSAAEVSDETLRLVQETFTQGFDPAVEKERIRLHARMGRAFTPMHKSKQGRREQEREHTRPHAKQQTHTQPRAQPGEQLTEWAQIQQKVRIKMQEAEHWVKCQRREAELAEKIRLEEEAKRVSEAAEQKKLATEESAEREKQRLADIAEQRRSWIEARARSMQLVAAEMKERKERERVAAAEEAERVRIQALLQAEQNRRHQEQEAADQAKRDADRLRAILEDQQRAEQAQFDYKKKLRQTWGNLLHSLTPPLGSTNYFPFIYRSYEARWSALLSEEVAGVAFHEFPWPVHGDVALYNAGHMLTHSNVRKFIGHELRILVDGKTPKDKIKGEMLRWHPDKFLRILPKVAENEMQYFAEASARIMGILADLKTEFQ